jgi:hypothetical protein
MGYQKHVILCLQCGCNKRINIAVVPSACSDVDLHFTDSNFTIVNTAINYDY